MEIRRILRPGGVAYITAQTDHSLEHMTSEWPVYRALIKHPEFKAEMIGAKSMARDRYVFRWRDDTSYSSNTFLSTDYIHNVWGRVMPIVEIRRQFPGYQDVVLMQKKR